MAGITVSHLSFTYPQETVPALRDVSFSVEEGEFLTVIGPSGGGKSTLLRALKPALTPHGSFTGDISFFGEPLSALDARRQAAEIGFVLQKPDEQIVTDRVWHELAFGMESLGFATPVIRRRVAEMASFFGIEEWFSRPVEALSGGQKQLLNLASVMALQPRVLLLDEPTSQLDPIAAADFLNAVARIRRELGTTVILSEHRLEEALPLCDRVLALEQTVLAHGTPQEVSRALRAAKSPVYFSMPTPVRVSGSVGADKCPVTVTEGRQWLAGYAASHPLADVPPRRLRPAGEELLGLRDVWFRYEKDGEDVLQDLSCSFARGQLTALLGGNGSGKTTTLSLLAGLRRPLRGKRFCRTERIGLLPQDPQMLFDRATVRDELREQLTSLPEAEQARRMQEMACFCRLEGLLDRHPYDLSGGEQQRAALAKLLLAGPELLLLDEPTKGMDAQVKRELAAILNGLLEQGATVVMVSHDVEFCAQYADRCLLMFDGSIAAEGGPTDFFAGNHFYTTAANRMARGRDVRGADRRLRRHGDPAPGAARAARSPAEGPAASAGGQAAAALAQPRRARAARLRRHAVPAADAQNLDPVSGCRAAGRAVRGAGGPSRRRDAARLAQDGPRLGGRPAQALDQADVGLARRDRTGCSRDDPLRRVSAGRPEISVHLAARAAGGHAAVRPAV